MLPKKKAKVRSHIERGPKLIWNRHRRFIRSLGCCIPNCDDQGLIEVAHVRSAANAGTGIKPIDGFAVGMCHDHHHEQHSTGVRSFEAKYKINLFALAHEYVEASPDWQLRDTMRTLADWSTPYAESAE